MLDSTLHGHYFCCWLWLILNQILLCKNSMWLEFLTFLIWSSTMIVKQASFQVSDLDYRGLTFLSALMQYSIIKDYNSQYEVICSPQYLNYVVHLIFKFNLNLWNIKYIKFIPITTLSVLCYNWSKKHVMQPFLDSNFNFFLRMPKNCFWGRSNVQHNRFCLIKTMLQE